MARARDMPGDWEGVLAGPCLEIGRGPSWAVPVGRGPSWAMHGDWEGS